MPEPGQKIGDFRLDAQLSQGARTLLFEATQLSLGRKVALKVLRPELSANAGARATFRENGRRTAMLIHPGIVPVYDIAETPELIALACKLVGGASFWTLGTKVKSVSSLLQTAMDLFLALKPAHENGLVHGNLHPGNAILTEEGTVCLTDFGEPTGAMTSFTNLSHAPFMHPDPKVRGLMPGDLYSVGRVLLFLYDGDAEADIGALPTGVKELVSRLVGEVKDVPLLTATDGVTLLNRIKHSLSQGNGLLPPPDRRKYRRLPATLPVQVAEQKTAETTAKSILGRIGDLSENGAFVPTASPLTPGSFVRLKFALEPQKISLDVFGVVRWVEPGAGMGIQFIKVSTADSVALKSYVSERQAAEIAKVAAVSGLHRQLLKFLRLRWGVPLSETQLLSHLGTSRVLLMRAVKDLQEIGLIRMEDDMFVGVCPAEEDACEQVNRL